MSNRERIAAVPTGSLGVPHLESFWSRHRVGRADPTAWVRDVTLLAGLRVGLRETFDYLLRAKPSLETFESWILDRNGGAIDANRIERLNAALCDAGATGQPADRAAEPVLSANDLDFWREHGYVVVHDAVPRDGCRAAVQAICDFTQADLQHPETWYGGAQGHSIWIPLLHHPALHANRISPRIHRAFAQLWNREDIWINVDQAGMNPPERPGWRFPGPHLHWDVSLVPPIPFGVQGMLYLADTAADQGAFTCVPGFHKTIDDWLTNLPDGVDPRAHDFSSQTVAIAGRAGDLVIWHHALPHGSSPNRAALPRFVQYVVGKPSMWDYTPVWR
jgi:hypothetical protein